MRIPLSITRTYRPNWGLWEGVRELIQNAKDAEVEHNAPFRVEHSGNKLLIVNEGCTLNHRALLLGETTKADRDDLIGQWGDGLKIGVLALVRSGYEVTIKSGEEIWRPSIEEAPEYGNAEVLTFAIRKARLFRPSVEVEVEGVSKAQWQEMARRFRFLPGEEYNRIVHTVYGDLLLDEPGMLYVKGIFVEKVPDMAFGYDFKDVELDVDRRTVKSWSRESECKYLLEQAMVEKPELTRDVFHLLCEGKKDVASFRYNTISKKSTLETMKELWVERHGENTIPVTSAEEAASLEHLGVRGVVVNQTAVNALGQAVGTADTIKAELAFSTSEMYDLDSIPESETLLSALCVLEDAGHAIDLKCLQVVDFKDTNILGQYDGGTIKISRGQLAKGVSPTLITLVHELGHGKESMGLTHGQAVESIMQDLVSSLLGNGAK